MLGYEPFRVVEMNAIPTIDNPKATILETYSKLKNWEWRTKAKLIVAKPKAKPEDKFKNQCFNSVIK